MMNPMMNEIAPALRLIRAAVFPRYVYANIAMRVPLVIATGSRSANILISLLIQTTPSEYPIYVNMGGYEFRKLLIWIVMGVLNINIYFYL